MVKNFIFFLNSIAVCFLLVLLVLSYFPPSIVPFIPSVTLLTPVLLVVNILFFLYWFLSFSKRCLLSLISLLICISFISSFFQLQFKGNQNDNKEAIRKLKF